MENRASKNRKIDLNKEGIKIIKVAAFCFAIISWIATAQGLHKYIFQDYYWQALLASFAIQSFLFVLNLKLPYYFEIIGKKTINREKKKSRFGKNKINEVSRYKWTNMQKIIVYFYVIILFTSSFFSFVYITNLVYRSTQYIDSNVILNKTYQTYLNDVEKYSRELTKITQIVINSKLSELQNMVTNQNINPKKTKDELEQILNQVQQEYDFKIIEETKAKDILENARKIYETSMEEYWRSSKDREDEKKAFLDAQDDYEEAQKATATVLERLNRAQYDLDNYKPTVDILVNNLLIEIIGQNSLDLKKIDSQLAELNKRIFEADEKDISQNNFAEIVTKTTELTIAINNYRILQGIQSQESNVNTISSLKNDIDIVTPVPTTESFLEDKDNWEEMWKDHFLSLEKVIRSLPNFSEEMISEIDNVNQIIDVQELLRFDAQGTINKIDVIVRSNLTDINALERAVKLLFSDFPFLAWFSLILSIFFDVFSLLAGLFIHATSPSYHLSINATSNNNK